MSRDDYLLDPNAEVDPEVKALEDALAPLKFAGGPPSERVLAAQPKRSRPWPWVLATAAAAAAVWLWMTWPAGELYPGCPSRTFVADEDGYEVRLGELATITLQKDSTLTFVHWRDGEQALFRLERGGMTADVVPPPRVKPKFFVVETDRAKVVDLGCRYDLVTSPDGTQRVLVENGAVSFGDEYREVFVPAGALAILQDGEIGTPTYLTASSDVKKLVQRYDDLRNSKDPSAAHDVVDKLTRSCTDRGDTLPLWHMLQDGDLTVAKMVTEALFRLVGGPDGNSQIRLYPADVWLEFLRAEVW